MTALLRRIGTRIVGWRELPWGLILVVALVLGIIVGGFWAAGEIYRRANDGVCTSCGETR